MHTDLKNNRTKIKKYLEGGGYGSERRAPEKVIPPVNIHTHPILTHPANLSVTFAHHKPRLIQSSQSALHTAQAADPDST